MLYYRVEVSGVGVHLEEAGSTAIEIQFSEHSMARYSKFLTHSMMSVTESPQQQPRNSITNA